MKVSKYLRSLFCVLLIGFNANQLGAASIGINKPNFGDYTYSYTEKKRYLEISEKDSGFFLRIVDENQDNRADLVRLLNDEKDITFMSKEFNFRDDIKEVQLFDLANQFLDYFSDNPKKIDPNQAKRYNQYLKLIKRRFLNVPTVGNKANYDFNKFFSEKFKPQDTIEDLVMYSYVKYSGLIREAKVINPKQTFQDLLDNCNLFDKLRFLVLSWNYGNNLGRFGYRFEGEPLPHGDFFEIDLLDKTKTEKDSPYLKIEMNMNSIPDSVDVTEIRNFLKGKSISFFKYDQKGNYLYGGFKCNK